MSNADLNFNNTEVKKSAFDKSKYPINIDKVDIEKIETSNKISYGKKGFTYFIGYKNDDKIKPLISILPEISGYINTLSANPIKWSNTLKQFIDC